MGFADIRFPNTTGSRIDAQKHGVGVDQPVTNPGGRREQMANAFKRIPHVIGLDEDELPRWEVDFVTNRELQLVDDQFAFFVAAKIKTVHAKYAALFRIANDAQR